MPNVCHHGLSSVYFLERGTRLIWNSTEPKFVPFRFFWHPWHPWGRIHIDLKKILSNPAVSADFYPLGSGFRYFFWLGCLEILLLSMPKSLEAITVQKSKNATMIFGTFFWFFFSKNAHRSGKNGFHTPNKSGTCFKHYNFFDEKQLPQKFWFHGPLNYPSTSFLSLRLGAGSLRIKCYVGY